MDTKFQILFNCLGLNLNAKKNVKNKEKTEGFWKFLHFLQLFWCIFLLIFQYFIRNELHIENTVVGILSDEMETLLPIFVNIVMLIEAWRKKALQKKLCDTLRLIDQKISSLCIYELNSKQTINNFMNYFLGLIGVCSMIEFMIISIPKPRPFMLAILLRTSANLCNRFNDFQFICYVLQISHSLKAINNNLIKTNFSNKFRFKGIQQEVRENNVKTLKEILSETWRATNYINIRFGFSMLCTITNHFSNLIVACFFIYFRTYRKSYQNLQTVIVSVSFVGPPVITMSYIFYVCWRS